jgi:hypothetical protein
LAALAVACSHSASSPPPPPPPASSGDAGDAAASDGASPDDSGREGGSIVDANACAPAASDQDCKSQGPGCINCCSCFHAHGVATYNAAEAACVCQASACQTACASSLCASPPANPAHGDACDTCVAGALGADAGGGCSAAITAACDADSDCVALSRCAFGTKPNDPNACP